MGARPVRQPGWFGARRPRGLRLQADDPAAGSQPCNEVRCGMACVAPGSADQPRLPAVHGRAGRSAHVADVDGAADAELSAARLLAGSLLGPARHIRRLDKQRCFTASGESGDPEHGSAQLGSTDDRSCSVASTARSCGLVVSSAAQPAGRAQHSYLPVWSRFQQPPGGLGTLRAAAACGTTDVVSL